MNEVHKVAQGKIRLYACGGGAANIAANLLEDFRGNVDPAAAELLPVYIDTSKSNMARNRKNIDPQHCYFIDGKDGSGGVRSENYEAVEQRIKDIVREHKPLDLNIVICMAAGGSGSVIGPSIVTELAERELPTVVIMVGDSSTRLETQNTLKTIKSFESIARLRKVPVVAFYVENSDTMSRQQADNEIKFTVLALSVLFSRQNHELDTMDLYNWLRYDRIPGCSFPAQLSALTITDRQQHSDVPKNIGHVISVATIATEPSESRLPVVTDYQCRGFLPDNASDVFAQRCPLRFYVSDGIFSEVAQRMDSTLDQLDEAQQARISKRSFLSKEDQPNDKGVVL